MFEIIILFLYQNIHSFMKIKMRSIEYIFDDINNI